MANGPMIEERRQSARRKAQQWLENERRMSDRRQQQIWEEAFDLNAPRELPDPPVPDWVNKAIEAEDEAYLESLGRSRPLGATDEMAEFAEFARSVEPQSYWDRYAAIKSGEAAAETTARDTARIAAEAGLNRARGGMVGQLGRLGQRAMGIPGVRPALRAGRVLGSVLGPAGPFLDVAALAEIENQYSEGQEALRHLDSTRTHAQRYYGDVGKAKTRRETFGARRNIMAREDELAGLAQDPNTFNQIQFMPDGSLMFQLPDGTMIDADNMREQVLRSRMRNK